MSFDLVQIRTLAETKEDENWKFRQFLKNSYLEPAEIDQRVFEATNRVWANIDCTSCANCCREAKPGFSEEDVSRLARRLGVEHQEFIDRYLEHTDPYTETPWQTRTTPCPFLRGNLCSVYEDRPADCKGYPYLYHPDFVTRTMAMIDRTFTCPIVYHVIEEVKTSLGFLKHSHRHR